MRQATRHYAARRQRRLLSPSPAKALRSGADCAKEAAARLQEMLAAEGIAEEEMIADFKRWRAGRRK
jgi:hypothetical protein